MNKEEYKKLINKRKPKEKKGLNLLIAFLVGGFLGLFSELYSFALIKILGVSKPESYLIVCITMIFFASLFTAIGFFDNLVSKGKCGLIIPTTGFAHSVSSAAIDYRHDGLITGIGANIMKLAGSVILYGIISAFFLCLIKVIING